MIRSAVTAPSRGAGTATGSLRVESATRPGPGGDRGRTALPKWSLGAPDSRAEREADTVARRIERGEPAGPITTATPHRHVLGNGATAAAGPLPAPAASALDGLSGGGRPLTAPQQHFYGNAFARSGRSSDAVAKRLGDVRIHDDGRAAAVLDSTGARAANAGSHILTTPGAYRADRPDGGRDMAHEMTHALQSPRSDRGVVRRVMQREEIGAKGKLKNMPVLADKLHSTNMLADHEAFDSIVQFLAGPLCIATLVGDNAAVSKWIDDQIILHNLKGKLSNTDIVKYFIDKNAVMRLSPQYDQHMRSVYFAATPQHGTNNASFVESHLDYILQKAPVAAVAMREAIATAKAKMAAYTQRADMKGSAGELAEDVDNLGGNHPNVALQNLYGQLNNNLDEPDRRTIHINLPVFGGTTAQQMGKSASIRLTPYSSLVSGSDSSNRVDKRRAAWEDLLDPRHYHGKRLYIRGHLLNANLSGPELPRNLVPLVGADIAHGANSNMFHSHGYEQGAKQALTELLDARRILDASHASDDADISNLDGKTSAFDIKVTAEDGGQDPFRQRMATASLEAVQAIGKLVHPQNPGDTTSVEKAINDEDADGGFVMSDIQRNERTIVMENAFKAVQAEGDDRVLDVYRKMVSNAGIWVYDKQYVPRSLTVEEGIQRYEVADDKKTFKQSVRETRQFSVPNTLKGTLQDYDYAPGKHAPSATTRKHWSDLASSELATMGGGGGAPGVAGAGPVAAGNAASHSLATGSGTASGGTSSPAPAMPSSSAHTPLRRAASAAPPLLVTAVSSNAPSAPTRSASANGIASLLGTQLASLVDDDGDAAMPLAQAASHAKPASRKRMTRDEPAAAAAAATSSTLPAGPTVFQPATMDAATEDGESKSDKSRKRAKLRAGSPLNLPVKDDADMNPGSK